MKERQSDWLRLPSELWRVILGMINQPLVTARFVLVAKKFREAAEPLYKNYVSQFITTNAIPGDLSYATFYRRKINSLLNRIRQFAELSSTQTVDYPSFVSKVPLDLISVKAAKLSIKFLTEVIDSGDEQVFINMVSRLSLSNNKFNSRWKELLVPVIYSEENLLIKALNLNSMKAIEALVDATLSSNASHISNSRLSHVIEQLLFRCLLQKKFDIAQYLLDRVKPILFNLKNVEDFIKTSDLDEQSAIFLITNFQERFTSMGGTSLIFLFLKSKLKEAGCTSLEEAFGNQEKLYTFFGTAFRFVLTYSAATRLLLLLCKQSTLEIVKLMVESFDLSVRAELFYKPGHDSILKDIVSFDTEVVEYIFSFFLPEQLEEILLQTHYPTAPGSILSNCDTENLIYLLDFIAPDKRLHALTRQEYNDHIPILENLLVDLECASEEYELDVIRLVYKLPSDDLKLLFLEFDFRYISIFHLFIYILSPKKLGDLINNFTKKEQAILFSIPDDNEQNSLHRIAKAATLERSKLVLDLFIGNTLKALLARDFKHRTPLHYAAKRNEPELFFVLFNLIPTQKLQGYICYSIKDADDLTLIDFVIATGNAKFLTDLTSKVPTETNSQLDNQSSEKIRKLQLEDTPRLLFFQSEANTSVDSADPNYDYSLGPRF